MQKSVLPRQQREHQQQEQGRQLLESGSMHCSAFQPVWPAAALNVWHSQDAYCRALLTICHSNSRGGCAVCYTHVVIMLCIRSTRRKLSGKQRYESQNIIDMACSKHNKSVSETSR